MHASYSSSVFATTVGYDIAYGRTASISITKFSSHQNQFPPVNRVCMPTCMPTFHR